jgi:hypothetical protein
VCLLWGGVYHLNIMGTSSMLQGPFVAPWVGCWPINLVSPGSTPDQYVTDLWWTKWQWDGLFSEYLGFPMSVSFQQASVLILMLTLVLTGEMGQASEPSLRAVFWTALFWVITQLNYNPKERSSQLLRGGSLKSRRAMLFFRYRGTTGSQTTSAVLCMCVRKKRPLASPYLSFHMKQPGFHRRIFMKFGVWEF